jgi:beta-glucanase (GH16 family)
VLDLSVHRQNRPARSILGLALLLLTSISSAQSNSVRPVDSKWTMVWSDEFNQPNGSKPDPKKWTFDIGGDGWGNHESEYYTDSSENAYIQDGVLVIKAQHEDRLREDGVAMHYTSARLKTQGKFSQTYGRFEARIKIPYGQGLWPAFWMLGEDIATVGWAVCGEIDIMENIGREPSVVHGTIHGPRYSGSDGIGASYTLPSKQRFADDFHLFAVEWEPGTIRFYVDNVLYETRSRTDLPTDAKWVFDHPFFLLLNVAVGGDWPGDPDTTTVFPQSMQIDYLRVYSQPGKADK